MPISVADVVLVRKQVLEMLIASPEEARYSDAIGTNSEFAVLTEITDKIIIVDEWLVGDIIATPGNPWRQQFMAFTADLDSGTQITPTVGVYGEVKAKIGGTYSFSTPAKSREEVLRMIAFPSLYTSKAFHWIEDGIILSPADKVQVQVASFTKTAACQSPQTAEPALIYGTCSLCEKNDSESGFFKKCDGMFQIAREYVKTGQIIPPMEQLEQMIASGQVARAA